jgi:transposase-like protein
MSDKRTHWSPELKDEALRLFYEQGAAAASRQTGIPSGTIRAWGTQIARVKPVTDPAAVAAERATLKALSIAERKAVLTSNMIDDIERLRSQLFAPAVERKAFVVSGGQMRAATIEIAEVELDQPTFADQKNIVAALATLLDKVLLLTGDATARTETITSGDVQERALAAVRQLRNVA